MRAIRIREPGGPEVLELAEVSTPEPAAGEVRVRIRSAGLNRADILQRLGRYPAPAGAPQDIPGLEFAGEIDTLGPGVDGWSVGDRVMGVLGGGGYAEFCAVPAEHLMRVPAAFGWTEAGAVPEVFLTAADALFERGKLCEGERVLIHSAGGGVGTAALQLARVGGASLVIGTASVPKLERIRALGLPLDLGVDRHAGSFANEVRRHTDEAGVDVILDTVGAPYWEGNVSSLAPLGRLVVVGVMGGSRVEVDLRTLMGKRATVVGTVLRARSVLEKAALTKAFSERFLPRFSLPEEVAEPTGAAEATGAEAAGPAIETAALVPVIDRTYPLAEAGEAHRYVESNQSFGKVLLVLD